MKCQSQKKLTGVERKLGWNNDQIMLCFHLSQVDIWFLKNSNSVKNQILSKYKVIKSRVGPLFVTKQLLPPK